MASRRSRRSAASKKNSKVKSANKSAEEAGTAPTTPIKKVKKEDTASTAVLNNANPHGEGSSTTTRKDADTGTSASASSSENGKVKSNPPADAGTPSKRRTGTAGSGKDIFIAKSIKEAKGGKYLVEWEPSTVAPSNVNQNCGLARRVAKGIYWPYEDVTPNDDQSFTVQWKDTWEPEENLLDQDLLQEWKESRKDNGKGKGKGKKKATQR